MNNAELEDILKSIHINKLDKVVRKVSNEFKWPIAQFMTSDVPELDCMGKDPYLLKYLILLEVLMSLLAACVIQIVGHVKLNKIGILEFIGGLYVNFGKKISDNLDKDFDIVCETYCKGDFPFWNGFSDN